MFQCFLLCSSLFSLSNSDSSQPSSLNFFLNQRSSSSCSQFNAEWRLRPKPLNFKLLMTFSLYFKYTKYCLALFEWCGWYIIVWFGFSCWFRSAVTLVVTWHVLHNLNWAELHWDWLRQRKGQRQPFQAVPRLRFLAIPRGSWRASRIS